MCGIREWTRPRTLGEPARWTRARAHRASQMSGPPKTVRVQRGPHGNVGLSTLSQELHAGSKQWRIIHLAPGGPAAATGELAVGDVIRAVDHNTQLPAESERLVAMLRGEPHTMVSLTVERPPPDAEWESCVQEAQAVMRAESEAGTTPSGATVRGDSGKQALTLARVETVRGPVGGETGGARTDKLRQEREAQAAILRRYEAAILREAAVLDRIKEEQEEAARSAARAVPSSSPQQDALEAELDRIKEEQKAAARAAERALEAGQHTEQAGREIDVRTGTRLKKAASFGFQARTADELR
jgi:hypothetical protein